MHIRHYILDGHTPREVGLIEWARWFEDITNRIVDFTQVTSEVEVSTVFTGVDHRFGRGGPPLLFETMIFGGPLNGGGSRYSSWDDAQAGHKGFVRKARAALKQRV